MLSPALFTLFTSDCSAIHSTNTIVKFADDTTIVGLILDNDETHCREEIQHLTQCTLLSSCVNNIKFLGIHITSDLTWSMNTAHLVKKAQQRLFFLRKLKRAGLFLTDSGCGPPV
ncbi:hypothetical protein L3Q82_019227 [Scortum barcoo]|uniref:Uncharacterized protein n=1 Tax=Scortum barcoo TaxID=214431 RepID=A0ACB8VAZ5_9TELE|nr:hypothetical protein L3Q82_019227 [Scortum barcoo]